MSNRKTRPKVTSYAYLLDNEVNAIKELTEMGVESLLQSGNRLKKP